MKKKLTFGISLQMLSHYESNRPLTRRPRLSIRD